MVGQEEFLQAIQRVNEFLNFAVQEIIPFYLGIFSFYIVIDIVKSFVSDLTEDDIKQIKAFFINIKSKLKKEKEKKL